jgi:hypothetical protein
MRVKETIPSKALMIHVMCIHDYLESIVHKSKMMKITEDRQQSVGQGYACDTPDGDYPDSDEEN